MQKVMILQQINQYNLIFLLKDIFELKHIALYNTDNSYL